MKIFSVSQIRQADHFTIKNEPISSVDLMERAAQSCFLWFSKNISKASTIAVFCGLGNNGGDGLALSRMLIEFGYNVHIFVVAHGKKQSPDGLVNQQLLAKKSIPFTTISENNSLPEWQADVYVDALLGTGLTQPLRGISAKTVQQINTQNGLKIAIDIPTGLFADDNQSNNKAAIFRADHTLTFQFPKFSFLFPEYGAFAGEFHVLNIGLSEIYLQETQTPNYFIDADFVSNILPKRHKWNHKGTFGHAVVVAGSRGKMGAAILSSRAALKSGAGLVTAFVPQIGLHDLQTANPEVMVLTDKGENHIGEISLPEKVTSVAIGPGLGQAEQTQRAVLDFLAIAKIPLVIDADALNILSQNNGWHILPENSIVTPHLGELQRILGVPLKGEEMYERAKQFAKKHKLILLVKGAHTAIYTPAGDVFFNSTGCHGMATAGSGDVLTGIIAGLLAQSISPKNAAIIGAFFHGKAGEEGVKKMGNRGLLASDIINQLKIEHG